MSTQPDRPRISERAVRERLDRVTDPELDESIVALDYVDDITVEKARETGLVGDDCPEVFRTPECDPIPPERFELVQRRCRLATVNMGGQGSLCDALNEARRAEDRPPLSPDEHIP
jgi:3-deoxy-D-manno-octulosonate 8-phosphate phosphatase KdsC-like HAD superfamily phosphatase